jgi:hypothetical protein
LAARDIAEEIRVSSQQISPGTNQPLSDCDKLALLDAILDGYRRIAAAPDPRERLALVMQYNARAAAMAGPPHYLLTAEDLADLGIDRIEESDDPAPVATPADGGAQAVEPRATTASPQPAGTAGDNGAGPEAAAGATDGARAALEPEQVQLGDFISVIFCRTPARGYASLRTFFEGTKQTFDIVAVPLTA